MFPIDMLYWFYKSVKDTDNNGHDWGTGYGGGGYGSGGGGGGWGYGGGGGFGGGGDGGGGESSSEPEGAQLNEDDDEVIEDLQEFVRMEVRGILAEDFVHNEEEE